jgi:phenylalanyl-tRNA synthetase alpha chain
MNSQDPFQIAERTRKAIESFQIDNAETLEQFRIRFIGSKGAVKNLFATIKEVSNERKREFGLLVNQLKQNAEAKFQDFKNNIEQQNKSSKIDVDLSRPTVSNQPGSRHPINLVKNQIISIFAKIGFQVAEGPEIEDDWHNFTALNIPSDHPARDMQDTFFIEKNPDVVLRTHTSPVQIRYLENNNPPLRIIAPGRVYRVDNDSSHSPVFHQVEGLYIAKGVSFAELKQTLFYFVHEMFGKKTDVRFRPSFFPFTEPSAEMDINWKKNGKKSWMEILGCGMVDPAVLENCNIDPEVFTGYAFGLGIDRISMLKYGIDDIRLLYENDKRFLSQFGAE